MSEAYEIFRQYLTDRRIVFSELGDEIIQIDYRGEDMKTIPLVCSFNQEQPDMAMLLCVEIARYTKDNCTLALALCNSCNQILAHVRFYMDDSYEVIARCDVRLHEPFFCDDIIASLNLMAASVDAMYPEFVKEMWS